MFSNFAKQLSENTPATGEMPTKMVFRTEEARTKDPHFEVEVGIKNIKKTDPLPKAPRMLSANIRTIGIQQT